MNPTRIKKSCERCKALKMLSQEQPVCLLGHSLHPEKIVPLEPCKKPTTYAAFIAIRQGAVKKEPNERQE